MNLMFLFQFLGSVDSLPRTSNLDQNPRLVNSKFFIQFNDMQSLGDGSFLVEREAGVDFCGYTTRDDFEDFFAKFNEKTVQCGISLLFEVATVFFSVLYCDIDEFCIGGFLGGSKKKRRVTVSTENNRGYVVASWGLYCAIALLAR